jgi:hypothetical protein
MVPSNGGTDPDDDGADMPFIVPASPPGVSSLPGVDLWELGVRESIRDTIARYNHAGDAGRFADMVACFTPAGTLTIVGGAVHRGHDELTAFFSGVGPAAPGFTHLRHCVTNVLIDVDVDVVDAATAASYFEVVTDIGLDHWGRYRDRFEPVGGRWLLAERSVKTDGYAPNSYFA